MPTEQYRQAAERYNREPDDEAKLRILKELAARRQLESAPPLVQELAGDRQLDNAPRLLADFLMDPLSPVVARGSRPGFGELLRGTYSSVRNAPLSQLLMDPLGNIRSGYEEALRKKMEEEELLEILSQEQPIQVRQAAIEGRLPRRVE